MLNFLVEHNGKSAQVRTATEEMKNGTPLNDGHYVAVREMQYDGLNAAYTPRLVDNDDIKVGDLYTEVPVMKGERIATDQITGGDTMSAGAVVKADGGKFVADTAGTTTGAYVFVGEWTQGNPYGVTMYILDRVLP